MPEDILKAVQEESQAVSRSPNFWTSRVRRCGDQHGGGLITAMQPASEEHETCCKYILQERLTDQAAKFTACEAAIRYLQAAYMRHVLPDGWVGAEWWIQVRLCIADLKVISMDGYEHAFLVYIQSWLMAATAIVLLLGQVRDVPLLCIHLSSIHHSAQCHSNTL